jgi:hypothetical protein
MKPTALHIERWLNNVEARIVPPERKCLQVIVHELREGESREKAFAEMEARYPQNVAGKTVDDLNWSDDLVGAQEKSLAEHIATYPEDAGRTVEDFNWIEWVIVHPKFIIGADGRVRWPAETIEEGDTDKDTDASETLRTGLDQAGSTPELDGKGGPHHNHEPIDLPPPDPGFLARSKP